MGSKFTLPDSCSAFPFGAPGTSVVEIAFFSVVRPRRWWKGLASVVVGRLAICFRLRSGKLHFQACRRSCASRLAFLTVMQILAGFAIL
jgi:hypothetical protein